MLTKYTVWYYEYLPLLGETLCTTWYGCMECECGYSDSVSWYDDIMISSGLHYTNSSKLHTSHFPTWYSKPVAVLSTDWCGDQLGLLVTRYHDTLASGRRTFSYYQPATYEVAISPQPFALSHSPSAIRHPDVPWGKSLGDSTPSSFGIRAIEWIRKLRLISSRWLSRSLLTIRYSSPSAIHTIITVMTIMTIMIILHTTMTPRHLRGRRRQ